MTGQCHLLSPDHPCCRIKGFHHSLKRNSMIKRLRYSRVLRVDMKLRKSPVAAESAVVGPKARHPNIGPHSHFLDKISFDYPRLSEWTRSFHWRLTSMVRCRLPRPVIAIAEAMPKEPFGDPIFRLSAVIMANLEVRFGLRTGLGRNLQGLSVPCRFRELILQR
jgi:hypothetical protein